MKLDNKHKVLLHGFINLSTILPPNDFMLRPLIIYTEAIQISNTHV